jgi:hypothetical protein
MAKIFSINVFISAILRTLPVGYSLRDLKAISIHPALLIETQGDFQKRGGAGGFGLGFFGGLQR